MKINVKLKSLTLTNFMGVKDHTIEFSDKETVISGKNESGKTTRETAFRYLFTGKDAKNEELNPMPNNIKLNDGSKVSGVEPTVSGVVCINGKDIVLERRCVEKFKTDKETQEKKVSGYTTKYKIGIDTKTATEYNDYLFELFNVKKYKEYLDIFNILTNVSYFESKLDKVEKRIRLIEWAGGFDDIQFALGIEKFKPLVSILEDSTLDARAKTVREQIKNSKDDLVRHKNQLEENITNLPECENVDDIMSKIDNIAEKITKLNSKINSSRDQSKLKNDLENELSQAKRDLRDYEEILVESAKAPKKDVLSKISKREEELRSLKNNIINGDDSILRKENQIKSNKESINNNNRELDSLRESFLVISNEAVDVSGVETNCPHCKQSLPVDKVESSKKSFIDEFNKGKNQRLDEIQERGKSLKNKNENLDKDSEILNNEIVDIKENIIILKSDIKGLEEKIEILNKEASNIQVQGFVPDEKYTSLKDKTEDIQVKINNVVIDDISSVIKEIDDLNQERDVLKEGLGKKDEYDRRQTRIDDLNKSIKEEGSTLVKLEGVLSLISDFKHEKMKKIEDDVNSMFKFVKFKLFEKFYNGENKDVCEFMYKGVTVKDGLNTASIINGGLDIVNTASKFYNIELPVFIDGEESVNDFIETNSQIVSLRVTKSPLKIVNK